jgi:imidazolonepropionase-like amidohydrolase
MTVRHLRGVFLPDEVEKDAWIVGGRLTFERYTGDAETICDGGWIIPGFVDAHCHIGLSPEGAVPDEDGQTAQAVADRDAGALLLRDVGSPVDNTFVQRRTELPRLIRGGRHIARPHRYIKDLGVEIEPAQLVAEVERQAKRGDGWVKLVGDWIDRAVGDLAPVWPDDVFAAAVARAHELGVRVAVHVFGEDALPAIVAAGVDSIEHGSGLGTELLDEVARRGIAVVPTLINIDNFPAYAERGEAKFPTYAAHMRSLYATSRDRVRAAWEAGIPVYAGTDAGGSLVHGRIQDEVRALVGGGMPAADVIAQASWRAREWLGLSGLTEGAEADLLAFADDPRMAVETIEAPTRMVLRGAVIR